MRDLKNSVLSNALTIAQKDWGGTHDTLLGFLMWTHNISVYGIGNSYYGGKLPRAFLLTSPDNYTLQDTQRSKLLKGSFIIHNV